MIARYADVLVVGGGSAGAVVAARLSENAARSVMVIEAGPDHRSVDTPEAISGPSFLDAIAEPGRVWPGLLVRRAAGAPLTPYLRGRGIGGSSAVNAMVGLTGEPDDYDAWEREHGCVGWAWTDVAPVFGALPMPLTTWPDSAGPLSAALIGSAGVEPAPLTRHPDGRRVSTNDAYLEPARSRANLSVVGDSMVDRVLFNGRRAAGVRLADGREVEAGLVVVCAGAIHSPAILMRSGVGRPGVGRNLCDHPAFALPLRLRHPWVAGGPVITVVARGTHAVHHDLQVVPMDQVPGEPGLVLLLAAAMHVHSRGSVRLASADPLVEPAIDFAMLSDERDNSTLRAAISWAQRLAAGPAVTELAESLAVDTSVDGVRVGLADYVHAAGTCRMGASDDEMAVVDTAGAVIGYEGLVVCDASVMPSLPRANTLLPTLMVAERIVAHYR
jgi:5-(hydroxymethyl)furfural/furfural oxidase